MKFLKSNPLHIKKTLLCLTMKHELDAKYQIIDPNIKIIFNTHRVVV